MVAPPRYVQVLGNGCTIMLCTGIGNGCTTTLCTGVGQWLHHHAMYRYREWLHHHAMYRCWEMAAPSCYVQVYGNGCTTTLYTGVGNGCTTLHTGVGKWLHHNAVCRCREMVAPSHPTWGEPQGFTQGMLTNSDGSGPSSTGNSRVRTDRHLQITID